MKYIAAPLERTGFISVICSLSRHWANCSGFMNLAGWSCSYWQMRCSDKWWGWGISAHLGQRMRLWQQHQLCSPEGENEPQLVREVLCLQWPMWHMPAHGQCWWRWLQHLLYLELLGAKHRCGWTSSATQCGQKKSFFSLICCQIIAAFQAHSADKNSAQEASCRALCGSQQTPMDTFIICLLWSVMLKWLHWGL